MICILKTKTELTYPYGDNATVNLQFNNPILNELEYDNVENVKTYVLHITENGVTGCKWWYCSERKWSSNRCYDSDEWIFSVCDNKGRRGSHYWRGLHCWREFHY
ncbi:MAG: hypothetical protein ACLTML_21050 [Blautia faecis]